MPINLQYNKTPYPKKNPIQKNIKNIKKIKNFHQHENTKELFEKIC